MSEVKKRMCIFAGPNGSGKSTLFEAFSKNYSTGHFVNADVIEKALDTFGRIGLDSYNIKTSQAELEDFFLTENASSLIKKAEQEGYSIKLRIEDNCFCIDSKNAHSYECSLAASFLRVKLIETDQSFSFETVMSHQSKLEDITLIKSLGYATYLY